MATRLEALTGCRTSADVIVKLEMIRDKPGQSRATQRRASFYITEVMEDMIDKGGDFSISDDYLSEITAPPYQGHRLED